ncbi:MAG: cmoA [Actinoallomurus sp.]|nr:cmoA [Actinoallomurus sp.]
MTTEWLDDQFVQRWTAADTLGEFLELPRRMAATVVADDRARPETIVDIGSGPGEFLRIMLETFPRAAGVWTDVSETMADTARERLADLGDRVTYLRVDMLDLSPVPHGVDIVVSSRASHHLDAESLARFYTQVGEHLAPGGWVANLDHVGLPDTWNRRLRAARRALIPPAEKGSGHAHPNPLPTASEHLDALRRAGFTDVETPWRGLYTCLFLARNSD